MEHHTRISIGTVEDIPVLNDLIVKANTLVAKRFDLTPENCPKHPSNSEESWIERDMDRGVNFFLLYLDDEPVGCVALEKADEYTCYLERLCVLPESQNRGYGSQLVQHCIQTANEWGVKEISIGIIRENMELRTWYEKWGFKFTKHASFEHLPFGVTFMEFRV